MILKGIDMLNRKKKLASFKEFYAKLNAADGSQQYADTTVTAEGEYAQGQDQIAEPSGKGSAIGFKNNGPTFTVEQTKKDAAVNKAIAFLEKLQKSGVPTEPDKLDMLLAKVKQISDELFSVGIEPIDLEATIKNPNRLWQYLITGPSAPGGGGKGALEDLKNIRDGGVIADDESNPGGADVTADIENIDLNTFSALNDPNNGKDQPEGALEENFMDGKGPGRKGDSKRHGIKKKASLASLDKIVRSKTASPRKKQLAHWQANMRRGKAKKR